MVGHEGPAGAACGRGIVWTGLLGGVIIGVTAAVIGPQETWIVADLGIDHTRAALTQTALFAGQLTTGMMAASFLARAVGKRLGLAALALMALGNVLCVIPVYEVILAGRFVTGGAISLMVVFFSTVYVTFFESVQARLLALLHAAVAAGAAVTVWNVRAVAAAAGSWTFPFWVVAGLSAGAAAVLISCRVPALHSKERAGLRGALPAFRARPVLAVFLVLAALGIAAESVNVFLPACAEKELGLSVRFSGIVLALFWIGMILGRFASFITSRWLTERAHVITGAVFGSVFLLASLRVTDSVLLSVVVLLAGVMVGPIYPQAISYAVRCAPGHKSSVVAMGQVVSCAGAAKS